MVSRLMMETAVGRAEGWAAIGTAWHNKTKADGRVVTRVFQAAGAHAAGTTRRVAFGPVTLAGSQSVLPCWCCSNLSCPTRHFIWIWLQSMHAILLKAVADLVRCIRRHCSVDINVGLHQGGLDVLPCSLWDTRLELL